MIHVKSLMVVLMCLQANFSATTQNGGNEWDDVGEVFIHYDKCGRLLINSC